MESLPVHQPVEGGVFENAETIPAANIEAATEKEAGKAFENPAEDPLVLDTEENITEAANGRMEKMRSGAPEEISDEELWERAYEEESVEQWNKFTEENPEKTENYKKERERWYEKARVKAEQVMKELDPDYEVVVEHSIISPNDGNRAEYRTATLAFRNAKEPERGWTMEIEPSNDYIENRLPGVIRNIYDRKRSQEASLERNAVERKVKGIQNIKFDFLPTKDEKYLSGELDRLDKLDQIKADVGIEGGNSEMIWRVLSNFKQPKRFILNRGTIQQQIIEISADGNGVIAITEKVVFGNQKNIWQLRKDGTLLPAEDASLNKLKQLFNAFNTQIKAKSEKGEAVARPE